MTDDLTTPAQMEVKSNYTRNRSERIPEHWKIRPLGELIRKIEGGGTPSKEVDVYWNGRIPWASVKDLSDFNPEKTKDFISHEGLKNSSSKLIPKGTVITSTRMAVGTAVIFDIDVAINQDLKAIFPTEELDPKFLLYYFIKHQKRILYLGTGSTVKGIQLNDLKKLPILLPPIEEQNKIVNCLSNSVVAIENLNRLIEKKELRKKGLMQQLLIGKKRLPGFSGKWKEQKFKKIANRVNRKNSEGNDNVITISAQRGFVRQEDFFKKRVASKTLSNYTLVNKGEYCYNKSYSQGYPMGAFKRLDDFDKAVVTALYICFSLKDNVNSDFMNHYFEAGKMIPGLMRVAQEGGRAHGLLNIGLEDFFNLIVKLPSIKEQNAIATVLNTSEQEINLLQEKLKKLKMQKKGLMQVLLTGKKRLI